MKILCVADHIDPLVYSMRIKDRFSDVDLILSAGDLPMEYLGFIASSLNKPVLFVFGNHNLKRLQYYKRKNAYALSFMEEFQTTNHGSIHVDLRTHKHKKLLIAGLGGSIRYNKGENQFSQTQMWLRVLALIPRLVFNLIFYGKALDILLTHSAPYGINDRDDPCHRGFKSFLWFMRVFKPRYLVHGHIHLYDQNDKRETNYYHTQVINVYDHYILNTDTN
jgi:Icc-related predicted phosphoesterase